MKKAVPFLAASMLLGSCSPPPPAAPPGTAAESSASVPFRSLGWANERFTHEGQPFTGTTTDHYKSGALKARYGIREGKYHGLVEEWYENGQQKTKTSYDQGRHEGDNFYWNEDGSLQAHKVWKNDNLVSERTSPASRLPPP
jgi:hypothetical protein